MLDVQMSRTGWQQQLQLHRVLVNPFLYQFWHGAHHLLTSHQLEGLCRQTLPFISFQGFLTGREVSGLGKQQRSAGFSQLDNPPC